jgi:hypothetical protein
MATTITSKDEFTNTTDGWIGAVQIDHTGKAVGVSVEPGGSVFLSRGRADPHRQRPAR